MNARFGSASCWRLWAVAILAASLAILVTDITDWLSHPASNGSLLEHGSISVADSMGIPRHVLQGPMSPEGSEWVESERNLLLGTDGGEITIRLDETVEVRALLLQGVGLAATEVETSVDSGLWTPVWSVEPSAAGRGMTSKHLVLDPPVSLNALRVRNAGTVEVAAIGAIRAYAEVPSDWPIRGPSVAPRVSSYPPLSIGVVLLVKFCVAVLGASLLVASWWLARNPSRHAVFGRIVDGGLIVVAALAALAWFNMLQYSSEVWERTHFTYWDASHYYLGAKYAPSIGYDRLYHCMLVADSEAGLSSVRLKRPMVRDLSTNKGTRARDLMSDPEGCKRYFSPDRWAEFRADQAHFRTTLAPVLQLKLLHDHGYNGTPVWSLAGRSMGAWGPADERLMRIAFALDPILLAVSFALIAATFGARALSAVLILFGTAYVSGNWFTGGAFLRFGWFAAAVAGICCLKRGRWMLAGSLLATAAMLRVFPAFLLGGVALHAIVQMVDRRRLWPSPEMLRFGTGAAATLVLLFVASLPAAGGLEGWSGFTRNTIKHMETARDQNIGFGVMTQLYEADEIGQQGGLRYAGPIRTRWTDTGLGWAVRAVAAIFGFALLVLAVRRQPPWVCAILGFAWMGFVIDVSNYYYCGLALFGLLAASSARLVLPYAAFVTVWAGLGLVYHYNEPAMYGVASALLLVFTASVLWQMGFGPPIEGDEPDPTPL